MSDMEKIILVSLLLAVAIVSTVWLIIRAQRGLRLRAQAALAQLCRVTGLNAISVSESVFDYIRTYRSDHPLQCARGTRDGLEVELAVVPDLGGESDDGRVTMVGISCRGRFQSPSHVALASGWAIDRKMAVWLGVPTGPAAKIDVGPYSVWGDVTQAQMDLILPQLNAIMKFRRRLRWLILNSDGVLLVWNTLDAEWESDVAVVEKAFSLGIALCRSL